MGFAWFVGAAGVAAWQWQVQASPARVFAAVAIVAAAGVFAARKWLRTPQGLLAWDGLGWTWTVVSGACAGEPEVVLDAQRVLLLRWRGAEGPIQWLWLERGAQPARWDDLRRAVYSRASPP
jgi:hypothetical protein